MKLLPLYVACVLVFSPESNAQIEIPEIKIPEIGIRTDPINVPVPKADIPGDIQNPGRIPGNIEREFKNAAGEMDRMRLEAMAQTNAPVLAAWLTQSRNDAMRGGVSPIPPQIRQEFTGFYDDDILNRVRFKVGDSGVVNLGNLSINYGERDAVVLIDVVVFRNASDIQDNVGLWAHELKHVQQYRDWGVHDFAIRYLRSWNGVENDAIAAEGSYQSWAANRPARPSEGRQLVVAQPTMQIASMCATPYGACGMGVAIPQGFSCFCPSFNGPIWGVAQ